MPVDLQSYMDGSILVVRLSGQLDGSTAPKAQQDTLALLSAEKCRVALDLEALDFLSSAGLRLLLAVLRACRSLGGDLRLARAQPAVADVINMGFANMVKMFGTLPGVLASFEPKRATGEAPAQRKPKWTNEFLDRMRMIGDPPADDAVGELFHEGKIQAVNKLMKDLVHNDFIPPADLPPVIRRYLENTSELPSWADWTRIKRGQMLFERHGMQMVTVLFCGSLPVTYCARKGVHVLALTNRLNKTPYRRIIETSQLVMDVMTPGGLQRDGMGLRSAQKVRLMHAAVRYLLIEGGYWDMAAYDYPINQEDLAGTLMAFSYAIGAGMPLLGVTLSPQEIEDYHHTWNVVGHVMGIMPEMLPENPEDAKELSDTIFGRQIMGGPEENLEGRELTANLLRMLQEMMPSRIFDEFPKALMRHLAGDNIAHLMGIEPTPWQAALKPLQWANQLMDQTTDQAPVIGRAAGIVFRQIMKGLMLHNLGGERTPFSIPERLQQEWKFAAEETEH